MLVYANVKKQPAGNCLSAPRIGIVIARELSKHDGNLKKRRTSTTTTTTKQLNFTLLNSTKHNSTKLNSTKAATKTTQLQSNRKKSIAKREKERKRLQALGQYDKARKR